jgi:parallel beta-helix repeat protein
LIIGREAYFLLNIKKSIMNKGLRILYYFWLLLFFVGTVTLQAQTAPTYYYVATSGDDSNPGTELLPWKTLTKAASMATAGVTVFVRQGTYNERLVPLNSGTAEEPVIFAAYPGESVTLTGDGMIFPGPRDGDRFWTGLVHIQDLEYIRISGLRILNSDGTGIWIGNSSYITIEKNYTDNTWSPGIDAAHSDYIIVEGNEISRGCMGDYEECISFSTTTHYEIKSNLIHNGFTEGIDVKVGSSYGIICGNIVYDQLGPNRIPPGIYVDSWDKHELNIEVSDNISYNNGIGITVGSENGGLVDGIRIHNNKVYQNDRGFWVAGWGIGQEHHFNNISIYANEIYDNNFGIEIGGYTGTDMDSIQVFNNVIRHNKSAGLRITRYDGPEGDYTLQNTTIINNTIFHNGTVGNGWDAENGGINLFGTIPENMLFRNNLLSNNAVGTIHVDPEIPSDSVSIDYNFFDGFLNLVDERAGTNAVYGDPLFLNSSMNDYHLQTDSPAIDKGDPDQQYNDPEDPDHNGYALYPAQGTLRNDIGAYGGPFASSWDLATLIAPPLIPTLVAPFNGATEVPTTLLLSWDGLRGAMSYQLQVSTSPDFLSLVIDTSIVGQSCGIKDIESNKIYYWRVKASNAGGKSSYSNTWNLTTKGPDFIEQLNFDNHLMYTLYQNYPNPFSQTTTIRFSLPKMSPVKLSIFNSLGMEIEVLVNKVLPSGNYHTQWFPHCKANGIYFYQLKTPEFIDMKKLIFYW